MQYLVEQLNMRHISVQDLYQYVLYCQFPNTNQHVIDPLTIAKIGAEISRISELQNWKFNFYNLAAQRGSFLGNIFGAECFLYGWGVNPEPSTALFWIGHALNGNVNINQLNKFFEDKLYYLQGQCYEKLGRYSDAMFVYCKITNKDFDLYHEVIASRARLIKRQVSIILDRPTHEHELVNSLKQLNLAGNHEGAVVSHESDNQSAQNSKKETQHEVPLLESTLLPMEFGKKWKLGASWFHMVDETALKKEYDKHQENISQLILAKKVEIESVNKMLKEMISPLSNTSSSHALEERLDVLKMELKDLESSLNKLYDKYEKYLPEKRKVIRRHEAEKRFFNPRRSKKNQELITLTNAIIDQRFKLNNNASNPINLNGKSSRQVISAERAFQEAVIALTGGDFPKLGLPIMREKPWQFIGYDNKLRSGTTSFGPIEVYQIGDTLVQSEHRVEPKRNRLGDSFLPQHKSYDSDISQFLFKLAQADIEKEKQIATYMIRYGKSHRGISLEELQQINANLGQEDVDFFNRICFLIMEKEQAQWHSAVNESFHIGMALAQARCLIMIEAGFISFDEAFKNNVLFGIYSNTGIIDDPYKVARCCKNIDNLYMAYLQKEYPLDFFPFLKNRIRKSHGAGMNDEIYPGAVATRVQAHNDMTYVYGGDSDTDGEGYDTDSSIENFDSKKRVKKL